MEYEKLEHRLVEFLDKVAPVRQLRRSVTALYEETLPASSDGEVLLLLPGVEKICDAVTPGWRDSLMLSATTSYRYASHLEAASRALGTIRMLSDVEEELGDTSPKLAASGLHPEVWSAASPFWRPGHYADAIASAAKVVNVKVQDKVGRTDKSDRALVSMVFADVAASPDKPRLRLPDVGPEETQHSLQEGVLHFAMGCFQALRNPPAHLPHGHWHLNFTEQEALEQLSAFSLLARWVDMATVDRGKPPVVDPATVPEE